MHGPRIDIARNTSKQQGGADFIPELRKKVREVGQRNNHRLRCRIIKANIMLISATYIYIYESCFFTRSHGIGAGWLEPCWETATSAIILHPVRVLTDCGTYVQ